MKNEKLNLSELRVKSFVTDFRNGAEDMIKGGGTTTYPPSIIICPSFVPACIPPPPPPENP